MKNPMSKTPVAAFAVAPHVPKITAETIAKFDSIADQWGATQGEIDDEEHAFKQRKTDTLHAAVADAKDGKDTSAEIERVEREHATTIAVMRTKLAALAVAVDETGNEMAVSIAEHRHEWLDRLDKAAAEAEVRYRAALADARAALADLAPARGAVQWLTDFNHSQARVGGQQQFSGGRLYVDTTSVRRESDTNPTQLLAVLETIASERPSLYRRAPVVHAAAASRFPVPS